MPTNNRNVDIDDMSDISESKARDLIGLVVARVVGREYEFEITFTNGTVLSFTGGRWEGIGLGVDLTYQEPR